MTQSFPRTLAVLVPAVLLGGAYISQYVFGLYPCEMCWWQRWPHFAALALGLLAFVFRRNPLSLAFVALAALAILTSGLIGGFHAGVEYGWWEGLTTCSVAPVASQSTADALDFIMNAPIIRCDVAPWTLFGISLAGYNFLLSVAGALAILVLVARNRA